MPWGIEKSWMMSITGFGCELLVSGRQGTPQGSRRADRRRVLSVDFFPIGMATFARMQERRIPGGNRSLWWIAVHNRRVCRDVNLFDLERRLCHLHLCHDVRRPISRPPPIHTSSIHPRLVRRRCSRTTRMLWTGVGSVGGALAGSNGEKGEESACAWCWVGQVGVGGGGKR